MRGLGRRFDGRDERRLRIDRRHRREHDDGRVDGWDDPQTGKYFLPEHVDGYAVKVFVPGVIRSERAYIGHLIANVREWREYEASLARLHAIEAGARAAQRRDAVPIEEPVILPPAYEWWMENLALIRDISRRRYPARLQTYDQVLSNPEAVIGRALQWIGRGDIEAAVAAVKPRNRTQTRPESGSIEPALARVFDDLYAAVFENKGISGALLRTLSETNKALLPELTRVQLAVARSQIDRHTKAKVKPPSIEIEGLPEID